MALMYCRECGKQVSSEAPVCPHCGVPHPVYQPATQLQPQPHPVYPAPPQPKPDTTVAALLSLVIPGVGQMYKGDTGAGVAFLIGTIVGYASCFFPGIVLHIASVIHAAQRD